MGRIAAPHGVRGWVKVIPFTQAPGALIDYSHWWIGRDDDSWAEREVIEAKAHGAAVTARFVGIEDRDRAAELVGCDVAVPRAALPEAGPNEYYWADLIGLEVVNAAGASLGTVASLFTNGAHDVMRVGTGKDERLVPFVEAVIRNVDLARGRIEVEWGLDW